MNRLERLVIIVKRILFQGDSITDMYRVRDLDHYAGCGYATLVAAELGYEYPGEYEFINRGIGGDRSIDLLARIKRDMINLKPDIISILVGVNDVWAELDTGNGISASKYESYLSIITDEISAALPDVKLMIMEPFVLKGLATAEKWKEFRYGVEQIADSARRVAKCHGIKFVPLMNKFDEALKLASTDYWTADGIHPKAPGHELIKREWIKAFKEL